MRPRPLVLGLLAVALVGCANEAASAPITTTTTSTPSTTSTTTTVPPTTTTTVALPDPVPVAWQPCGGGLDCATVVVPVSYADPTGATLELALVRNPADRPDQRIGSLLMNPGGPGASGVQRVARGFEVSPEVGDRFDVVGFDPRGVGQSTPISCGAAVPAFRARDLAPDDDGEAAALAAAAKAVADECTASEGERLRHLGSEEVAHDIEVIRRSLGEETLSFVGLSYGTFIGQLWADAYPTSVRALVLDGVLDAGLASTTASLTQTDGVDASFESMDRACAADPACPLTASGGLAASYDELARRLDAGEVGGSGVGPTQLAYAAFYATYDAATWPRLWAAVDRGLAGDLRGVAGLAADYTGLVPYTPFALITCLDGEHAEGYDDWSASTHPVVERSARFGAILANELLPCAYWPQGSYRPREVDAAGAPPVLVIGSTGDAATPYKSAVDVADHLESGVLLTVDLDGHVALGDSACATERATRYLVDLAVPEPGARC